MDLQALLSAIESAADSPSATTPSSSQDLTPVRPSQSPYKRRRLCPKGHTNTGTEVVTQQSESGVSPSFVRLKSNTKLAQKVLQIGDPDVVSWLDEFAAQLRDKSIRSSSKSILDAYSFPAMTEMCNGSDFVRLLPKLALAIESNIFGEQDHKIRKRIALAHFYHVYLLAQENPQMFLSWCDGQQMQKSMLPKGGYKSAVQHRFANLMFPEAENRRRAVKAGDASDWLKTRIGKIQTWRKNGKHWAKLIMRFGNGILLLLPPCLTDEE